MNKTLNTVLFLIAATICSLVVIAIFWLVPTFLYFQFIGPLGPPNSVTTLAVIVIFLAAIFSTYLLYNMIIKKIIAKVDMDKYFDPIFKKKKH